MMSYSMHRRHKIASCRLFCVALAVAGAALPGAVAHAIPPTPVAESAGEQAAKFYKQGNQAFEQKRWQDAEAAYLKAWAMLRSFDVAANLGEVELHLDKPRQAAHYLAYAALTDPPSVKPAQRERTGHFLAEARAKVGALQLRVNVPAAQVLIDGVPIASEELGEEIFADPGRRTIAAKGEGYRDAQAVVDVKEGAVQEVALSLTALAIKPEEPAIQSVPPFPSGRRSVVPLIALGAASGVGLVIGIATTVASNGKSRDADAQGAEILEQGGQCAKPPSAFVGPCRELKDSLRSLDTLANVARVAYVASGVLAVGAVVYALVPEPKRAVARRVTALPVMGREGGGILLVGAW
jgi:hypothetical protein